MGVRRIKKTFFISELTTPESLQANTSTELKTDNVCCPRIGPVFIKDINIIIPFPQIMFPGETIAAAAR